MKMHRIARHFALSVAALAIVASSATAQSAYYRQGTFAVGGGFNFPTSEMADYLNSSGSFYLAGGRHLNPSNTIQAEWTHNWLGIKPEVLQRAESDSVQFDNAYASSWSVTLNLVHRFNPTSDFVPWVTGGGGYYKRNLQITQNTMVYYPPIYDPWWGWIGGGWYPGEAITGFREANGFGWNIGAGIDLAIENGAALFLDVRYHQAVLDGVDITLVPVMVGVRW